MADLPSPPCHRLPGVEFGKRRVRNDRQNGGISTLLGTWKPIGGHLYSLRAYFFAFDPSGNPVALLRVDQVQRLITRINSKESVDLRLFTGRQRPGLREGSATDLTFTADRVVPQANDCLNTTGECLVEQ